jgi:hypothetical protein
MSLHQHMSRYVSFSVIIMPHGADHRDKLTLSQSRTSLCIMAADGLLTYSQKPLIHPTSMARQPYWPRPTHLWGFKITLTHNTNKRQTFMTLVGSELAIPASEQLQTHALYHAATGIGSSYRLQQLNMVQMIPVCNFTYYFFHIHFHFILLSLTGLQVVCSLCMRVIQKVSSDGLLRKKQEYITNHVYCYLMYIL